MTRRAIGVGETDGAPAAYLPWLDLVGTEGNDTLVGTGDDDVIQGLGGRDVIYGLEGNDLLMGGEGADDLVGGLGNDLLYGGEGVDWLFETDGADDQLYGEGGDDLLSYAAALSDEIANALLDGGDGDDQINYSAYNFDDLGTLIGGDGNDLFQVHGGDHLVLDAGAGADFVQIGDVGTRFSITLGAGSDMIYLRGSPDYFRDSAGMNVSDFGVGDSGDALSLNLYLVRGLIGWDTAANPFATGHLRLVQRDSDAVVQIDQDGAGSAAAFADLVVFQNVSTTSLTAHNLGFAPDGAATPGATVDGSPVRDLLTGAAGDDLLRGQGGNDRLWGGAGNDRLEGGEGDDSLGGELGDDELYGGAGNDGLFDSLGGDDQLFGEEGADGLSIDRQFLSGIGPSTLLLDGGNGDDRLIYFGAWGSHSDDVTLIGGAGNDVITAFRGGAVTIDGGDGAEYIEIDLGANSYSITFGSSVAHSDILALRNPFGMMGSFVVHDFTAGNGGDQLRMTQFLPYVLTGWDPAANPFATGHLRLAQGGADAFLLIDRDGGGDGFLVLGTLENVDAAQLTALNLDGDDPVGPVAIIGTPGDDTLIGGAGADELIGLGGHDFLDGQGGPDRMLGGSGNDTYIVENSGDVVVEGLGEGNDLIFTSVSYILAAGSDIEILASGDSGGTGGLDLYGDELGNQLWGNNGANILGGNGGPDVLFGFGGIDSLLGGDGGDYLDGGDANDGLFGGDGDDTMIGGTGSDYLDGGTGADGVYGGGGDDFYLFDQGGDFAIEAAGGGRDTVFTPASYILTAGSEIEILSALGNATGNALDLYGNELANELWGNDGVNILGGGGGNDVLLGFGGNDSLLGGDGADYMDGGEGSDGLFGEAGGDLMVGSGGNDYLDGGAGADAMYGGLGNDSFLFDNGGDFGIEAAGQGFDTAYASVNYVLTAGQEIEILQALDPAGTGALDLYGNAFGNQITGNGGGNVMGGNGGNDLLFGLGGVDSLLGDEGRDTLYGGAGNDGLFGGDGDDILLGGEGNDYLDGGAGADAFRFDVAPGGADVDMIVGFSAADDVIELEDAVFGGLAPGALDANAFVIGTAALDTDDRVIYDGATGSLLYDADGSGPGAAFLIATLHGAPAITASDFIVV